MRDACRTVVLASRNQHKLVELRDIVAPELPYIELVNDDGPEPVENGTSFEENALIKARAAAGRTGLPAIADDSGIGVDVMNGSPGIFSARWAGPSRSDRDNLDLLLWQMSDIAPEHREAAFYCAAALVLPDGDETVTLGVWRGSLATEPHGDGGFGYDPIFLPEGETGSAADLAPERKNAISHRHRAFLMLVPELRRLVPAN
ncbi:MAG: RdgB/HAM1 family non-canonical purine NTP pyrophosphatase [Canibacter sp.]